MRRTAKSGVLRRFRDYLVRLGAIGALAFNVSCSSMPAGLEERLETRSNLPILQDKEWAEKEGRQEISPEEEAILKEIEKAKSGKGRYSLNRFWIKTYPKLNWPQDFNSDSEAHKEFLDYLERELSLESIRAREGGRTDNSVEAYNKRAGIDRAFVLHNASDVGYTSADRYVWRGGRKSSKAKGEGGRRREGDEFLIVRAMNSAVELPRKVKREVEKATDFEFWKFSGHFLLEPEANYGKFFIRKLGIELKDRNPGLYRMEIYLTPHPDYIVFMLNVAVKVW